MDIHMSLDIIYILISLCHYRDMHKEDSQSQKREDGKRTFISCSLKKFHAKLGLR